MGLFDKNMQYKADTRVTCPHCKTILDPPPKRKSKCPFCEKDIFVRTDPFNKQKIHYLNKDSALCLDMLRNLNVTEKAFSDALKNAQQKLSLGDVIWGLISKEKQRAARKGDWHTIYSITYEQARYYYLTGRDYFRLLQEAMKERLQGEPFQGITTHVEIITSRDDRTCEKCRSQDGMVFTIEEALEKMPLPVKCDNDEGWCRCTYGYLSMKYPYRPT